MGSLVLTVGTGSTWAMRAALVLAMSGLEWQEQVFDLEDAKELQRLKRLAPPAWCPGSIMTVCGYTTRWPSPSTCTSSAPRAGSIPKREPSGRWPAVSAPSCTPVFAKSVPCCPSSSVPRPVANRRWKPLASWPGCRPSGPRRGAILFWRGGDPRCLLCGDGLPAGELRHPAAGAGGCLSAGAAGLAAVAADPGQGASAVAGGRSSAAVNPRA